jgi:hypothetical protein
VRSGRARVPTLRCGAAHRRIIPGAPLPRDAPWRMDGRRAEAAVVQVGARHPDRGDRVHCGPERAGRRAQSARAVQAGAAGAANGGRPRAGRERTGRPLGRRERRQLQRGRILGQRRGATAPKPQRTAPRAPTVPATTPSAPPSGPAPKPPPAAVGDTATRAQRLPTGTRLELAVPTRICAPGGKEQRFTARLVAPVRVGDVTALAAKTTAVLYLKKGSDATPGVRLDSVILPNQPISVPSSDVKVTRGADGRCLRAGARLTATLNAPVTVRR